MNKTESAPARDRPNATSGSAALAVGGGGAAVQMKDALRGQTYDDQVGMLRPGAREAPVQAKSALQFIRRGLTARECIRQLKDDGWFEDRQKGSHKQFKHASKGGTVTVAGDGSDEIPLGTQKSIEAQAGITLT